MVSALNYELVDQTLQSTALPQIRSERVGEDAVPRVVSRFAKVGVFWHLRAKILAARAWRRGSDHLPQNLLIARRKCVVIRKKDRVLHTIHLCSRKTVANRCLHQRDLSQNTEQSRRCRERRDHEAILKARLCCSACNVPGPMERTLTNFG